MIFAVITHIESFCSAMHVWDFVRNVRRIMFGERTGASREETYGESWPETGNLQKSKYFLVHRPNVLSIDNFLGNNQRKNLHQLVEMNPPLKFFHLFRLAHLV